MIVVVDTSVLIDFLRGDPRAARCLYKEREESALHASETTRLEVLAGMRPAEATATRLLLSTLIWHPVDDVVAGESGVLGRQ